MKTIFLSLSLLFVLFSCKEDDSVSCVTCNSPQTSSFQVCRESNGNASVNGEDTNTNYDVYIADLQESGASCGS